MLMIQKQHLDSVSFATRNDFLYIYFCQIRPHSYKTNRSEPSKSLFVYSIVNLAEEQFGISALNKLGQKGIELPNIKGKIDIVDRELIIEDGALIVAANLKSNL